MCKTTLRLQVNTNLNSLDKKTVLISLLVLKYNTSDITIISITTINSLCIVRLDLVLSKRDEIQHKRS